MQEEEVLRLEKEFSQAIVKNDAVAVGRLLADDWIIIDPDGGIIDRARFLGVMESGALTHEMMESDDARVRIYGNTAIVTALTTTQGQIQRASLHHEGAGDRCFCEAKWAMAMRAFAAH